MVVKRTFATKLEPVDAFGLSNELLRPRGFQLDKGSPPRNQSWRRGVDAGKKARGVVDASQTIDVEFNNGKINVTATAGVTGRKSASAQLMMTAYAEALEQLLVNGETPDIAGRKPKRTETAIKRAAFTRSLSICSIIIALIGGAAIAATKIEGVPNPLKLLSGSDGKTQANGKKKTPPVVIVRRAGSQQTSATKPTDSEHP